MSKVAGMHCSRYLSVPTLESLAHSSSSCSSGSFSRSSDSFSTFDPGASDSQTDTSPPQSPEGIPREYGSVSTVSLKVTTDHVGLDSNPVQTPKQRLFKLRSDFVDNIDDIGYESGRESCVGTAMRRDRFKVLTKKRGAPARHHQGSIQPEPSISEEACAVLAPETASAIGNCNQIGSRTIDNTFQLPSSRKEVTGLGLGLYPYGLAGGTISVDHLLESTSTTRLICPPKPLLVPISDAASPSPIHLLPSPVIMLGLGALQRMPSMPDLWSASSPNRPCSPSNSMLADVEGQKNFLTSMITDLPVDSVKPIVERLSVKKASASDCVIGRNPPLNSTGESSAGLGPSLLPEGQSPDSDNSTQKLGQPSLSVADLGPSRPLSQAIAFTSIPFYITQTRRKKSATGLGLGRPAGLDQRPQVRGATRSPSSHIQTCATGSGGASRSSLLKVTSPFGPCSPTRRRIIAGAKRLLKPHAFIKRRLYAIPEVVSPTSLSPIGMSVGSFSDMRNTHVETQDVPCSASTEPRRCTYMTPHLGTTTVTQSGVPSAVVRSGCPSPSRSFLSPILIHLGEPQKLNLVQRRSGGNTWDGFCSLI